MNGRRRESIVDVLEQYRAACLLASLIVVSRGEPPLFAVLLHGAIRPANVCDACALGRRSPPLAV
jgi:hypothetical protein